MTSIMTRAIVFTLAAAVFVGISSPNPARASDSIDPFAFIEPDAPGFAAYSGLISRLEQEGSTILVIDRTFLGRLRVVSVLNGLVREVILSPNTGEIRRDVVVGAFDPADFPGQGKGLAKGFGNGNANGQVHGNSGNGNSSNGNSGKSKKK